LSWLGVALPSGVMTRHEIATKAEILAIFERSNDLLNSLLDEDEDEDRDREREREHARGIDFVLEALRFCSVAAAALGDPSLGEVVMTASDVAEQFDDHAEDHHHTIAFSLSVLLDAGLAVDKHVRAFATSPEAQRREAVASGLRPRGEAERALLDLLAADPVAAVRNAAKKSLATVIEVPWWTGKWKSDPAARLLPGELETCGPALRRISEILDHSFYAIVMQDDVGPAELIAELAKLPGALAVEVIEHFCRSAERYFLKNAAPLFHLMFEREGGIEALERLIEMWGRADDGMLVHKDVTAIVRSAAPAPRLAVCTRLLALVAAAPASERVSLRRSPAWLAGAIVGNAWPPDVDVTPVLETALALGEEELAEHARDYARFQLADALAIAGMDPTPLLGRLVEARVAGYPGPWAGLGRAADVLLDRAPIAVLRSTAERALASEDVATIQWAAKHLLGAAFDAGTDGPPLERVRVLLAQPRLRSALVSDHGLVDRALAVLRSELRQGALSYAEAVETIEGIGRLHGGLAPVGMHSHIGRTSPARAEEIEQKRLQARQAVGAFLGPPELGGPPIEEEWAALRRAYATYPADSADDLEKRANLWSKTLSDGPWTPEERAVLDQTLATLRAGRPEVGFALGSALLCKPDADLFPLFDDVVALCEDHSRPLLKLYRADARETLGLPETSGQSVADGKADDDDLPAGNWEDEDEDDDDE
jgi:hypothetical protein